MSVANPKDLLGMPGFPSEVDAAIIFAYLQLLKLLVDKKAIDVADGDNLANLVNFDTLFKLPKEDKK